MSDLLKKLSSFAKITDALRAGVGRRLTVEGVWGSSAALLAAGLSQALGRPMLYVAAHVDEADDAEDDLRLFGATRTAVLPAFETAATPDSDSAADTQARRCAVLGQLLQEAARPAGHAPLVVVAPVAALIHGVPDPAVLAAHSLDLAKGKDFGPEKLVAWLDAHKYEASEMVEVPGDFARRGGIVDVFPQGYSDPVRIEWFGDTVDSIRRINLADQNSEAELPGLRLTAVPPRAASGKAGEGTTILHNYLPPDTLIAMREPTEIVEIGRSFTERQRDPLGLYPVDAILRKSAEFACVEFTAFGKGLSEQTISILTEGLPAFPRDAGKVVAELRELARTNKVVVYCDAPSERERFEQILAEHPEGTTPAATTATAKAAAAAFPGTDVDAPESPKRPGRIEVAQGFLHAGFRLPEAKTVLVGYHEVLHRYQQHPASRGGTQTRPIDSFVDLRAGDFVVHVNHGIGRFKGLQTVRRGGRAEEVLVIEYHGNAAIQVPVDQINLVQKYIGGFKGAPVLNKLGGTAWEKQKAKVAEAVSDLAIELLAVQAERQSKPGHAFPPDTAYMHEFEAAFPYTETPDQLRAVSDIKKDMEAARPMDRLLCGDVGYGKTEVAMRAAFKAAEAGKQVAILVPTTVLAEQHYRSFRERFDGFPFRIESVSRFRTAKEQRDIVAEARAGQVDILIGTHRLLSKDVVFKDLGLIIIDEEQRFGVEHKEKLKMLKRTVDVLTLTATPIPRTLHLSMLGLRDISSLATPPADRRSVYTEVTRYSEEKIQHALERELARGGQAYFVHNRVFDIQSVADEIYKMVPSAKIGIGHGQMGEGELEEVMLKFINKEYDILVSTTIIESGLDIPNANTMFIHDADMFGLADLHQLRGRVGRYKNRAYCYLLLPRDRPVTAQSQRRLKAIEDYSELGAGFRIAMRDLEIRGAGNILGPEQAGHIAGVGYEMYCQLMEEAVRKARNAPEPKKKDAKVDLGVDLLLPKAYIDSDRVRMETYRRITRCQTLAELSDLAKEMADRFGPPPAAARTVIDLNEIRILAGEWGIRSVQLHPPDIIFGVADLAVIGPLFARATGVVRVADANTVHLRLPANYLEPATLLPVLRKMLTGETIAPPAPPPPPPSASKPAPGRPSVPPAPVGGLSSRRR